jgi:hypothetical protein
MIRFVIVALVVILVWVLLLKLLREVRSANVDWKGWAVVAGFIALAFYLNHVTGIG